MGVDVREREGFSMATVLKSFLVFIFAWIASIWPGPWTALLMLLALSAMFLGMAMENYFANRDRTLSRTSGRPSVNRDGMLGKSRASA
jgi:4-hydroxybenzoate polyprenyltransferase